ncbi:HigA family addiction module antitoxin [Bordetella trematum]|uniref:HigA family addiction module antitoxin n=1 Tax=Bordetella trematum TaxID=123899 RepID=UPI000DE5A58D|nr:HigA family addiction module antitoxin [Bordetella trematum]
MAMINPPHPGLLIRDDVMAPLGLSLDDAATKFGVEAKYLSAVTEGREPVSAELAVNLERAGINTARAWIAMQEAFDKEKAMTQKIQDEQIDPFFITEEIEAEMVARGHTFEPPNHARTVSQIEILAGLSDDELSMWQGEWADQEREKRRQQRKLARKNN